MSLLHGDGNNKTRALTMQAPAMADASLIQAGTVARTAWARREQCLLQLGLRDQRQ